MLGFSLLELVLVIFVMTLLGGVVAAVVLASRGRGP